LLYARLRILAGNNIAICIATGVFAKAQNHNIFSLETYVLSSVFLSLDMAHPFSLDMVEIIETSTK